MSFKGDTLLEAMANKNFGLYAQALGPYLETYKDQKREGKATKQKSKDPSQEEDPAETQSSSAVTGQEVAVVPKGDETPQRIGTPVWTSVNEGPRILGGGGIPRSDRTAGEDETL